MRTDAWGPMIEAMRLVLLLMLSACNVVFPLRDRDTPTDASMPDIPRGTDGGPDVDTELVLDVTFDDPGHLQNDGGNHTVECLSGCGQSTTDRRGGMTALAFNGTSHCLVVTPAADLDANPMTISVWGLSSSITTAPRTTLFARAQIAELSEEMTYQITADNGVWSAQTAGANGSQALSSNRWHHVAITTRPQNNEVAIYFDGVLATQQTNDDSIALHYTSDPITIGCLVGANGATEFFEGSLDDIKLYSRVLSVAEIEELAKLD